MAPIRAQKRSEALERFDAEIQAAIDARQKEVSALLGLVSARATNISWCTAVCCRYVAVCVHQWCVSCEALQPW